MINPTKIYKNEVVADKLLLQNAGYTKVAVEGGFQLHPEGYVVPAPKAPVAPVPAVQTVSAAAAKPAKVVAAPAAPTTPVSMFFAGAREKDVYVITQPCGANNKERWFKKTDLLGVVSTPEGVKITAAPHVFTSRKIALPA